MLKKISNVSKYSVFNCLIFFVSLKGFLTSLIVFSSTFTSSSNLELFIIKCCEKKDNYLFLKKSKFDVLLKKLFKILVILSNTEIL